MGIDLARLAEPFHADDIEWRVSRAGKGKSGVYCNVLAYLTARSIQARFDEVCGPSNWRNEPPIIQDFGGKYVAFVVGISIRIDNEWITKWDCAEPTNIEPAKGGFSGGMKRAGAAWGVGRYLYRLDEAFAETSESGGKGWNYARLPEKAGGDVYYWKPPQLPAWALPKEKEHEVSAEQVAALKKAWRAKMAPNVKSSAELLEWFTKFVVGVCGEFPLSDSTCWSRSALDRCYARLAETAEGGGVSGDVPFDK